jgi:hypothetical protein
MWCGRFARFVKILAGIIRFRGVLGFLRGGVFLERRIPQDPATD